MVVNVHILYLFSHCVSFALLIIDFIVILHVRLIRVLLKINQSIEAKLKDRWTPDKCMRALTAALYDEYGGCQIHSRKYDEHGTEAERAIHHAVSAVRAFYC